MKVLLSGVTGTGLAAATAEALASGDAAAIILMGKSQAEAQAMMDDINHKYPKVKLLFITVDFGRLASVREAAEAIRKLEVPIDGFVGYPTVMAALWNKTEDGIESHFQNNYLSHFLLINLVVHLMPAGSRVVMVCSSIRPEAPPPAWDDPNFAVSVAPVWIRLLKVTTRVFVGCRMGRHIIHWMHMLYRCLPTFR